MPTSIHPLPALPPGAVLAALRGRRHPFLLASAAHDPHFGRYSFAGADPVLTLTVRPSGIELDRGEGPERREGDPLEIVRGLLTEFRLSEGDGATPLPAGAVGFLSYDLGRRIERLPALARDDLGLPDLFLGFYEAVATFDHASGAAFVTAPRAPERGRELARVLRAAGAAPSPAPVSIGPLTSCFDRAAYEALVARGRDHIARGDLFQVNLSQRFEARTAAAGAEVFSRLLETNPAAFAAWLVSPCGAEIVSASPERFLRVAGREVESCPIKGTRPRDADPERDRRLRAELLASEKDRAELTMIVDLVRSDLGRVAEFGGIAVPELPALTSHPSVHHLHGTVTARLAEGRDVVDLLRSAFPPGSVTGAPKVRAMEVIEESEPFRRGVYTGSIGYLSHTGHADLSVAIRTLVVKDGRVTFSVGGGVVADSDPAAEYRETLDKGRGLAAALGAKL